MQYLKERLYDPMWRAIIRPNREEYSEYDLGPNKFKYGGRYYQRKDYDILNKKGQTLKASLFREFRESSRPLALILHGNSSSRMVAFKYLKYLLGGGFDVMCFDFAGSGKSDGQFVTLGLNEKEDLDVVIRYIIRQANYQRIVLLGRSMGAVTALLYLADSCSPRIAAVVADSPFCDLVQIIRHTAQRIAYLPAFLADLLLDELRQSIKQKTGHDVVGLKPIQSVKEAKTKVPVLFIAAKADLLVPPWHTAELFKAYGGKKELVNCEGGHNDDRGEQLKEEIVGFLKRASEMRPESEGESAARRKNHRNIFEKS